MRTYNVALKEGIDYNTFWNEIETDGIGGVYIPERAVDIINERTSSLRQCWYELSDSEADLLRQDPRVYCVEIPPEYRDDIKISQNATQTGLYYKVIGTNPANNLGINWGLFRLSSTTNNTPSTSGILNYDYTLDGTGVDFVIQDSGCQIDHPEFTDANGVTRVNQIDWFAASGVIGTMPAFNVFYTDNSGHGTHCTGIAAGKTYGRAKNSRIYVMSVDGLTMSPTVGISPTNAFDCIKGWHNNKPVDPVTGYKRPTVVNMSWGYIGDFIQSPDYGHTYNYQGATSFYPANSPRQTQLGMIGSLVTIFPNPWYRFGIPVNSVDVDVAELLAAGVVLVGAAGNSNQTIDVQGGANHNNWFAPSQSLSPDPATRYYYMRGSSPGCTEGVICVGNIDTFYAAGTIEQKASSSESGPRVDVWAPGMDIVSAASNTNVYGASTAYPFNSSYRIMSIGGTSMASPNIAGIVAQMLQQNPGATPAQIRQSVIDASTPNVLYTTGQTTDYSDSRSLHGGPNRYGYLAYTPPPPPPPPGTIDFSGSGLSVGGSGLIINF
jgi:subtilisin family serine protease